MRYKREKSCSPNGLQSFIDEFTEGVLNRINFDILRDNLLRRLKICINDRLYEQQFYLIDNIDDPNYKNHLNIIKSYYDFYLKLKKYFMILVSLVYSGEGRLEKLEYHNNFNHSVILVLKNSDNEISDILPFTDTSQDTSYLHNLDFSKNICTSYNQSLLNTNITDWSDNDIIIQLEEVIKELKQTKYKFKKSKFNT
jgi:hypothetical protein